MANQTIINFLLHRSGLFHTQSHQTGGAVKYSLDPNSGGRPTLKEGALVYELIDFRTQPGARKVLFFTSDLLFRPHDLAPDLASDLASDPAADQYAKIKAIQVYLSGFQAYGYDLEGQIVPRCSLINLPIKTSVLTLAHIADDLLSAGITHHGDEDQSEISADELLIIDDALVRTMLELVSINIKDDPEILMLGSVLLDDLAKIQALAAYSETNRDDLIRQLAPVRCVVIVIEKVSPDDYFCPPDDPEDPEASCKNTCHTTAFYIATHLSQIFQCFTALDFLDLKLYQFFATEIPDIDPFLALSPKLRAGLVGLSLTCYQEDYVEVEESTYELHYEEDALIKPSPLPKNLEILCLHHIIFDLSHPPLLKKLAYLQISGIEEKKIEIDLVLIISAAPSLIHVDAGDFINPLELNDQKISVISTRSVFSDKMPHLKFILNNIPLAPAYPGDFHIGLLPNSYQLEYLKSSDASDITHITGLADLNPSLESYPKTLPAIQHLSLCFSKDTYSFGVIRKIFHFFLTQKNIGTISAVFQNGDIPELARLQKEKSDPAYADFYQRLTLSFQSSSASDSDLDFVDPEKILSPYDPLDFEAFDPKAPPPRYTAQSVFINSAGPIHPSLYLNQFAQGQGLQVMPTDFTPGPALPVLSTHTEIMPDADKTQKAQEAQGRMLIKLEPKVFFQLPNLPNGVITAIQLPTGCTYHQDLKTGQYAIVSHLETALVINLEWLINYNTPMSLSGRPTEPDFLAHLSALKFRIDNGQFLLERPIEWPAPFNTPAKKIGALATWISNFQSETAKTISMHFENTAEHLNFILSSQKGRCSERAFLLHVLINILFPEETSGIQNYYVCNDMHDLVAVFMPSQASRQNSKKMICFDLGGENVPCDLQPRPPSPSRTSVLMPAGAGMGAGSGTSGDPLFSRALMSAPAGAEVKKIETKKIKIKNSSHYLTQSLLACFKRALFPAEQSYILKTAADKTAGDLENLEFDPLSSQPRNACLKVKLKLKVKDSRENTGENTGTISQSLEIFRQIQSDSFADSSLDKPLYFIAQSLESLRQKIFSRNPENPTDPLFYLSPSPFVQFCEAAHPHKILIIPEDLLLKARGVSAYYPLLDNARSINDFKDEFKIPAEIIFIVLIQEKNLEKFREDFHSRFQTHGSLYLPQHEKKYEKKSEKKSERKYEEFEEKYLEALVQIQKKRRALSAGEAVLSNFSSYPSERPIYINTYNFDSLFPHELITQKGLMAHPGFLTLGARKIILSGPLSPAQAKALKDVQFEINKEAEAPDEIVNIEIINSLERPSSVDFFIIKPLPISAIKQTIAMLIQSPEKIITVLALPELGNPFVDYRQEASGQTRAHFTRLTERLMQENQLIILYGLLKPQLQSDLQSLATGFLLIAGERISIGYGTQVIILAEDEFAELEVPDGLDELDESLDQVLKFQHPFCEIKEGYIDHSPVLLTPWRTRLEAWKSGLEPCLKITAFDLMNPDSRSILRTLVCSAFGGQILIDGEIINLAMTVPVRTIEVSGNFMPASIRALADAFNAYESLETPTRAPTRTSREITLESDLPEALKVYDQYFISSPIILTDSRRLLIQQVDFYLQQKEENNSPPLLIIEGPSGIGKSAILRHYLSHSDYAPALLVLSPSETLIQELDQANREGKIVLIDELNTLDPDQLEAIEALVRSEPKLRIIGTQNPISFAGRKKLSRELINHACVLYLKNYETQELLVFCQHKNIPDYLSHLFVRTFQEIQNRKITLNATLKATSEAISKTRSAVTFRSFSRAIDLMARRHFSPSAQALLALREPLLGRDFIKDHQATGRAARVFARNLQTHAAFDRAFEEEGASLGC